MPVFIITPQGMLISIILAGLIYLLYETFLGFVILVAIVITIIYYLGNYLLDLLIEFTETPEERKERLLIKNWRNGVAYTKYPTKYELEQQALEKIKDLAKEFVKDFIEQGKTEFSHEDLKDFTVIVKFRNGINIPKLYKYDNKEHPLLLDILKKTYLKLSNNK